MKWSVGGAVRSSPSFLRVAVDLRWSMLTVCFMCLFFRWSVRRTLASMELSGGRDDLGTKGRLRYLPLRKEIHSISSRLLPLVTDERFAKQSMRAGTRVLDYIFFVIPCFHVNVVLAYAGGWGLIGHQDVALGDLCLSLKIVASLPRRKVFVSGYIDDPVNCRRVCRARKDSRCT